MPQRPEFDAELSGNEYNGSMARDDAFEKLQSCENEKTAQASVVDWLRHRRYSIREACPELVTSSQLFISRPVPFHAENWSILLRSARSG